MDHKEARMAADQERLKPGNPEFEQKKQEFIYITNFSEGAGMINNSAIYHADASYDFTNIIPIVNLETGGNFCYYDLNSAGTIFADTAGNPIHYYEFGGYLNANKDLLNQKLKVDAALRFDQSEFFTPHIAPRISVLYTHKENHHHRASLMQGYRNPNAKEQFINQDLATARLLGGLKGVFKNYEIPGNACYLQNVLAFHDSIYHDLNTDDVSTTPYQATIKHLDVLEAGIVPENQLSQIRPEQVFSFEIGYKSMFGKSLFLDASYFYSRCNDFIGLVLVIKPRTSPETDLFTAAQQINSTVLNYAASRGAGDSLPSINPSSIWENDMTPDITVPGGHGEHCFLSDAKAGGSRGYKDPATNCRSAILFLLSIRFHEVIRCPNGPGQDFLQCFQ